MLVFFIKILKLLLAFVRSDIWFVNSVHRRLIWGVSADLSSNLTKNGRPSQPFISSPQLVRTLVFVSITSSVGFKRSSSERHSNSAATCPPSTIRWSPFSPMDRRLLVSIEHVEPNFFSINSSLSTTTTSASDPSRTPSPTSTAGKATQQSSGSIGFTDGHLRHLRGCHSASLVLLQ